MLHRAAPLLLLLLSPAFAAALTPPPKLPARAADLAGFVPPGWRTVGEARGDLNGDGLADLVAVLGSRREEGAPPDAPLPPRLLLVALAGRGRDGEVAGYRRAVADPRAVLGRDEGGVFGDPFADLRVERGTVVLEHYGGSRERWAYTDRFRRQNGAWEQIGHTYTTFDAFAPDRSRTRDVNLNTGRVVETDPASGGGTTMQRTYQELSAGPLGRAPEWPPADAPLGRRTVRLAERADVVAGAPHWRGPGDLSATLSAATHGDSLYLRARVRDDRVAPGDMVRLVDGSGRVVPAARTGTRVVAGGYVWQGRYPLRALGARMPPSAAATGAPPRDAYALASVPASVEVWDADGGGGSTPDAPATLSTSRGGRAYPARVRFTRSPRLPRLGGPDAEAAFYDD